MTTPTEVTTRILLPLAERDRLRKQGLDNDTVEYGREAPFEYWESDHTALVHVLWHAKHEGLNLVDDVDKIASLIRSSRYAAAVKHGAKEAPNWGAATPSAAGSVQP